MTTFIAYGNIHDPFPFDDIPASLVPEKLRAQQSSSPRVTQRHQCRRLAHFLLWQLLQIAGKSPTLLSQIQRTESGRPYFPSENLDFNISHSSDWVAVILAVDEHRKSAVGIDIELPKKRNFAALMEHIAPKDEQDWFHQQPNPEKAFYRCWCLREAVLKSQGVGLVKLSEVRHFPTLTAILSAYCPKGELIFSDDLPFYLVAFVNNTLCSPNLYLWNGKSLESSHFISEIRYRVNPEYL